VIKAWIEANKQYVLVAGVADLEINMPRAKLVAIAQNEVKAAPTVFNGTPYRCKGWADCERGEAFVKVLLGAEL